MKNTITELWIISKTFFPANHTAWYGRN